MEQKQKAPVKAGSKQGKNSSKEHGHNPLKIEIAKELGLWDKILKFGWAELTAEESGRIGGIMTQKMRQQQEKTAK